MENTDVLQEVCNLKKRLEDILETKGNNSQSNCFSAEPLQKGYQDVCLKSISSSSIPSEEGTAEAIELKGLRSNTKLKVNSENQSEAANETVYSQSAGSIESATVNTTMVEGPRKNESQSRVIANHIISSDAQKQVLDILHQLGHLKINRAILSCSKVGITVGHLRRQRDPLIREISSQLVNKWKESIRNESAKPPTADTNVIKAISDKEKTTSCAKESVNKTNETSGVVNDTNANKGTMGNMREKACKLICRSLVEGAEGISFDKNEAEVLASDIEEAVYNEYVVKRGKNREYTMQMNAIRFNLADKTNVELNKKVFERTITAQQLALMASTDMASEQKKTEREKHRRESLEACQSDWDLKKLLNDYNQAASGPDGSYNSHKQGMFQCSKCKTYKTIYFQMQTRSSDEPMTTFVTCLNCQNRWKF